MKRQSVTTAVKVTGTAREVYEEEASIRRAKVEALKDSKRKKLEKKKKRTAKNKVEPEPFSSSRAVIPVSTKDLKHRKSSLAIEVRSFRKEKNPKAIRALWKKSAEMVELRNLKKKGKVGIGEVARIKQGRRFRHGIHRRPLRFSSISSLLVRIKNISKKRQSGPRQTTVARVGNVFKAKKRRKSVASAHAAAGAANSVMISYCRRNGKVVHDIHDFFIAQRRKVWVDWTSIPKSVDWWEAIKMGIEAANTCVVCLSNEFIKSKVCGDEIEHMLKHHKRIVPIVVAQDFNWDDVHPEIAKLNFIFFTPLPDDKTKLHDHLKVKVAELTEVCLTPTTPTWSCTRVLRNGQSNGINMAGIAVFSCTGTI